MSVVVRGSLVDLFICARCGITGKRAGLNATVLRDSKYRAKKFAVCAADRQAREGVKDDG